MLVKDMLVIASVFVLSSFIVVAGVFIYTPPHQEFAFQQVSATSVGEHLLLAPAHLGADRDIGSKLPGTDAISSLASTPNDDSQNYDPTGKANALALDDAAQSNHSLVFDVRRSWSQPQAASLATEGSQPSMHDWYAEPPDPARANLSIAGHMHNSDGQLVNVVLKSLAAFTVQGRVQDQNGLPIADVQVLISGSSGQGSSGNAKTDDSGQFSQTVNAAIGAPLTLQLRREGYQRYHSKIDTRAQQSGTPVEFDVTLQRGSIEVTGQVYDHIGTPVSNAKISLYSQSTRTFANGKSDDDGSFFIPGVLPADDYSVSVTSGSEHVSFYQLDKSIDSGRSVLQIQLQRHGFGSVSGRVVDSSGAGVEGLKLLVKTRGIGGLNVLTSDANGEFFAPRQAAGTVQISSDSAIQIHTANIELAAGQQLYRELTVDVGGNTLFGTVVDGYGEPLYGAKVEMQYAQNSATVGSHIGNHLYTATNMDGEFEFLGLGGGMRTITVSAPGFTRQSVAIDTSEHAGPHWITLLPDA